MAATPLGTHCLSRMAAPSGSADRPPMQADYSSLLAAAPRAVGKCIRCRRCLVHSRMFPVAVGEGEMCKLCKHLDIVTSAVAASPITTDDEEDATKLLIKVYMLLRKRRDSASDRMRADLSELDRIAAEPCRESAIRKERRKAREERNLNKPPKGGKDA